jgi:hypothetical protein
MTESTIGFLSGRDRRNIYFKKSTRMDLKKISFCTTMYPYNFENKNFYNIL